MIRLFFDTETSGFPSNKLPADHPKQAWIVQMGLILADDDEILNQCNFLVRAQERTITPGAQNVHGISIDQTSKGISEGLLSELTYQLLVHAEQIVAHNIPFDMKLLHMLFEKTSCSDGICVLQEMPQICTMRLSTDFCKLPGKYGYKWPKLQELYHILFEESFGDAHDALADTRATMRCYFKLKDLGVI